MKPENSSIIRAILSASDSRIVRDEDCDRRFMLHEKAQQVGFVETACLDQLPTEEVESHVDFLASFKVASELIR